MLAMECTGERTCTAKMPTISGQRGGEKELGEGGNFYRLTGGRGSVLGVCFPIL